MRNQLLVIFMFMVAFLGFSCKGKEVEKLKSELALKGDQVTQLKQQINHLQKTNGSLLDRMSDLSIVSKAGAKSIEKSLESLSNQYDFIQDLTTKIQTKDSLNLALVLNLKRSLSNINDEDILVEVRGGLVHVSISDKLLFKSGSSTISRDAKEVLGKIAGIINDHEDLEVMVEGHTDDIPMNNSCIADNWDLSVKRATAVVRMLQNDHYVEASRMTAAGRSEFVPKSDNETAFGRSANRRTEIVLAPRMDQFFKLLEAPELMN